MSNAESHAWNCNCAACYEFKRLRVLARMEEHRAAQAAAAEQAEIDRQARAVLSTYSPRRQWTTRYGAVFVEGLGFTSHGGAC